MSVLEQGVWKVNKQVSDLMIEDRFNSDFTLQQGRHHLYMSLACPFAHRVLLVINYLGLNELISFSSVAPERGNNGWQFNEKFPDKVNGKGSLIELYLAAKSDYSGRVSVPLLWDKHTNTAVNNDSLSIAAHLASTGVAKANNPITLLPDSLVLENQKMNKWLHEHVNRKVYHIGFANNQKDYEEASLVFFNALEQLDNRLEKYLYLFGDKITISDLVLLPTLVRMEAVYEYHFKANLKSLNQFKNLYRYMLNLLDIDSIRATVDIEHMKTHYYSSHRHINPEGVIPLGPSIKWSK